MSTADELARRLRAALKPSDLSVLDESARHRGHAGYIEGVQTHFRVRIRAQAFDGMSRVAQHRAVHEAVGDLMGNPIHALAIEAEAGDGT